MTAQAMPSALSVSAASSTSAVMRPLVSSAASHPCSARIRPGPDRHRVRAVAHDGRVVAPEPDVDGALMIRRRAHQLAGFDRIGRIEDDQVRDAAQHPEIFESQVRDPFDPSGEPAQAGDDDDVQARIGEEGPDLFHRPHARERRVGGGEDRPSARRETGRDRDQVLLRDADFDMMPGRLARERVQAHGAARIGGGGHHRTAFAEELEDRLAECRAARGERTPGPP